MKVLIVGGVAGGAGAATRLRRMDENADDKAIHMGVRNAGLSIDTGNRQTTSKHNNRTGPDPDVLWLKAVGRPCKSLNGSNPAQVSTHGQCSLLNSFHCGHN
jgi:NADPH-dependent 2,4-dienoyl-CoA reductase/sulfur reductase-like enzyme